MIAGYAGGYGVCVSGTHPNPTNRPYPILGDAMARICAVKNCHNEAIYKITDSDGEVYRRLCAIHATGFRIFLAEGVKK